MDINEITLHVKLKVYIEEELGYKILVFEDLEYKDPDLKYITCTVFPNWDYSNININEEGYLNIKYINAGKDTWYNGKEFIPYKYTNIQFLKFIKINKEIPKKLILD